MKYFVNVSTLDELRKEYRDWRKSITQTWVDLPKK